jgi:aryl-alcohol dehydrogenase-like predicted oxidoreductase
METRQFGKTDMRVSVLGFGASEIGFEEADQQTVDRLLREALDAGLNVIDAGECYRDSEEMAHYAAECGAFDSMQTSISIADQGALGMVLPIARERDIGVMAKRPLANVAWKTNHKPPSGYHHEYWDWLRKLNYPFLQTSNLDKAISGALRFVIAVPDVHIAIIGTTKPERWKQNAALLEAGLLKYEQFQEIRDRWCDVAPKTWIGQT